MGTTKTVTVGGLGGSIFNSSSILFVPTIMGLILGLLAIGLALGTPKGTSASTKGAGAVSNLLPAAREAGSLATWRADGSA
ncbi:MAG: hypothetical protein WC985_04620 [Thermoplasmata archaeon]